MCDIASLSLAATVVGGVVQAYGQQQAGKAAQQEANYKAAIDRNNQIRAGYLADDARARGKIAEQNQRTRGALLISQMRAVLAGSGQVIDQGSAGDMVIDQSGVNELDALNVRTNAEREAYGFEAEAANFGAQSNLYKVSGANARSAGNVAAAGTILSTGGIVADKWYKFKDKGAFD